MSTKKGKSRKGGKKDKPKAADKPEVKTCPVCGEEMDDGMDFCSTKCEVIHLKNQLADRDERIEQMTRRKGPVQCLGRIDWSTCVVEFYTKSSFDAKRRAMELRKLGHECNAQGIGEVPLLNGDGETKKAKVTVLVAAPAVVDGKEVYPPEPEYVDGLRPGKTA